MCIEGIRRMESSKKHWQDRAEVCWKDGQTASARTKHDDQDAFDLSTHPTLTPKLQPNNPSASASCLSVCRLPPGAYRRACNGSNRHCLFQARCCLQCTATCRKWKMPARRAAMRILLFFVKKKEKGKAGAGSSVERKTEEPSIDNLTIFCSVLFFSKSMWYGVHIDLPTDMLVHLTPCRSKKVFASV